MTYLLKFIKYTAVLTLVYLFINLGFLFLLPFGMASADDFFEIYQCQGVNYEVPNCATSSLTFIASTTVWSFRDILFGFPPSGQGTISLSATTTAYRNYAYRAKSSLFPDFFDWKYFSINWISYDVNDFLDDVSGYSSGQYDRDYY